MLPAVMRVPKNAACFFGFGVGLGLGERLGGVVGGGGAERHHLDGDNVAACGVDPGGGGDEVLQRSEVQAAGGGLADGHGDGLPLDGTGRDGPVLGDLVDRVVLGFGGGIEVAVAARAAGNSDVVRAEDARGASPGSGVFLGLGRFTERQGAVGIGESLALLLRGFARHVGGDGDRGVARAHHAVQDGPDGVGGAVLVVAGLLGGRIRRPRRRRWRARCPGSRPRRRWRV